MTNTAQPGILALWNDCREGSEAEYEAWYRGEHLRERVGLPGFRFGRRLTALNDSSPRYFSYYETRSPDVLHSPVYLERGANPTPMTRHIMTNDFCNMSRTVCRRVATEGWINGPFAVTIRANAGQLAALQAAWKGLSNLPDRLRAELWLSAENPDEAPSVEESIRGRDAKIAGCCLVNFSDEAQAKAAAVAARKLLGPDVTIGTYRLFCALDQVDITP
jgi:hypothetical protein